MVRRNGKVFFTGNSWLYEYLKFSVTPRIWLSQGGQATLDAYLNYASPPMNDRHMGLLDRAVYYLEEDGNLFVHGGFLTAFPIKNQAPYDLMWDRELWWAAKHYEANEDKPVAPGYKQVFIGHTSTSHERSDLTPIKASNVWNLDQGAGWEGKLTCMDVNTNEYWQSDVVKELYPRVRGR
jgi:serine/threonine protein phosphatase 1